MLELTADQLKALEQVRQNEVIEKIMLEIRQHNPQWLEQKGQWQTIQYLKDYREKAWALQIEEPDTVESFMRFGLQFPGFEQTSGFIRWMKRPVNDTPEQRFRDYASVMGFVQGQRAWRAALKTGMPE
ncbi:hypothetical protein C4K38_3948 [Pseudomonas chlororaphis subsp. piscium]|uniref:hypothetical protein n=1 Tax=Pseudomonas chlororaphis TaxID=587753 RepID=UPI0006A5C86B|nr:hypothetical protein [Pseudomonas chlororaphis]AZC31905.1 hypothetical protein C4K38_3948 [Pseudomonas chlororaphis subsp. piscium]WDG89660.1 hypothetical protein PUP49_20480 [Pseudomonas chlororaphis]SDS79200.1 hypothetical protein SAMN05216585_3438 [Pseudomonas chlororaphis]